MKKSSLILALAAGLIGGPALAQSPAPQAPVSTAPTPAAPGGVTRDQGAGVPGASASPASPSGSAGLPPSPQAGVPGTQAPSQLGR
ncbi:hypothetical protein ACFQX4_06100 [Roseomonas sp. GCM10028921]